MSKRAASVGDLVRYQCVLGDTVVNGVGTIIQGSQNTNAEGAPLARDGDRVNCGPCGTGIIQATAKNRCNGKKIARIDDVVKLPTGQGRIITATTKLRSR
jgi:uncharacterized Zn-binding protein involved in type VI secretion